MSRKVPPTVSKKALLRWERRRAFQKRLRELADEEGIAPVETPQVRRDKNHPRKSLSHYPEKKLKSHNSNHIESCTADVISDDDTPHMRWRRSRRGKDKKKLSPPIVCNEAEKANTVDKGQHAKVKGSLSKQDEKKLMLAFRAKEDDLVVFLRDSNILLKGCSFRRLRDNCWVDDEVVNGFVGLLNTRSNLSQQRSDNSSSKRIPHTVMLSSFFYTKIAKDKNALTEHGVTRWTKRKNIDVLTYELILIPLHLSENHWALSCVDLTRKEFIYLDSLYEQDHYKVTVALKKWLQTEITLTKGMEVTEERDVFSWSERVNSYHIKRPSSQNRQNETLSSPTVRVQTGRISRQTDDSSCGVFMMKFADCLSMGIPIDFTSSDISNFRKQIALALLRGSF